jgi:hypothetical protein
VRRRSFSMLDLNALHHSKAVLMAGLIPATRLNNRRNRLHVRELFFSISLIIVISACNSTVLVTEGQPTTQKLSPTEVFSSPTLGAWGRFFDPELGLSFEYPAIYEHFGCGPNLVSNPGGGLDLHLGHRIILHIEQTDLIDPEALNEEFIRTHIPDASAQVISTTKTKLGGQAAVRVEYRFGGPVRYAESTFAIYKGYLYQLDFSAGDFCDLPEQGITEGEAFEHMQATISFPN